MSRGGRGGGRGGRFGGRGGASVTHELIRDNLEDLGLDSFTHIEDRSPPPLYPHLDGPLPIIPTEEDIWYVYKMRELEARMRLSPFHLARSVEQQDIERYSDTRKR
ncbi:hypothetical protein B484DRAFT_26150 [Ochromonadaceae sp. CCMP2298]|nr:hypothetical protein B484DRAFT_26150 [Ochromonadaceae sp. CCMP2298]